ncbi:MAG: threalose-6-phosphate phosphatase [Stictis urceolatum]|nr:threalose-6-phosphate phosphatase [Stictis urceolata]
MEPFKAGVQGLAEEAKAAKSPEPTGRRTPQIGWNANSYFAPEPSSTDAAPQSPTSIASSAQSSAELLRKLSLVDASRPAFADLDPKSAYPSLGLSGNIISASICIPHSVSFKDGEWKVTPRRGTSALFDSFAHLSKPETCWNHTLVGWTGEVRSIKDRGRPQFGYSANLPPGDPSARTTLDKLKATAPVPVDESYRPKSHMPHGDGIRLSKQNRAQLETLLKDDPDGKIVPVWLVDESEENKSDVLLKDQARWRRYAEHDLYTLFHYKQHEPTDGKAERKRWTDYCRLNQKFADRILQIYNPGDIIWVHDYHLLLLPSLLRQRIPNVYVGFFLHVPFPSSEFLRCLGRRKEVLAGVLGSNMIGFQTYSYSRHFSSCCRRILDFETMPASINAYGAHIAVDVFPIGIDAAAVAHAAYGDPNINSKCPRIRELYRGMKVIIGRDRLDTVRGVAQKLQAYELFLERYPEWRGKVVLVQVTSPTSVEEEKEDAGNKTANKISDHVSRINSLYGDLEYTPVYHYSQYLHKDEYFALLRIANVGLITSVRDGMNTTSLEYVLCQRDNHGPLILSEFSGTASSLTEAININPWNLGEVADAINQALTMPEEKKMAQHKSLYKHVATNNVQAWSQKYLQRLLVNLASFNQSIATPALDKTKLLTQHRSSKRRLFMFDYDGTLTPIVRDPPAAIPSDRIIRTIKTLAKDKRNNVWIISGRDQAFLDEWMGHISELGLSAEHGSFVRQPEADDWENLTERFNMSWQDEVLKIFQHYTERTQGSFIERKRIALTWHFRRSDPDYGAFQARECKEHLENTVVKKWDVEVMNGKANLEVRPSFVNKGEIAKRLVKEYASSDGGKPDFVLCMGDDFTDEDMFRALRASELPQDEVFSVTVGASSKKTLASWHLLEPSDVISTIALLNGSVSMSNIGAAAAANQSFGR